MTNRERGLWIRYSRMANEQIRIQEQPNDDYAKDCEERRRNFRPKPTDDVRPTK